MSASDIRGYVDLTSRRDGGRFADAGVVTGLRRGDAGSVVREDDDGADGGER